MTQWRNCLLQVPAPITEAIRVIDSSSLQICLVVDESDHLLGTITDGDIRRAILRSQPLDSPVETVMNRNPITASPSDDHAALLAQMTRRQIHHLPIVTKDGQVIDLALLENLIRDNNQSQDTWVLLMAGGLGTRLRPLTEATPKPLLRVGNRPLMEIALENLVRQGFSKFYISVNYLAEQIKDALGDGARWGAEIRYIDETQRLGTAGALSLISEPLTAPLLVMNGDLLTKANLRRLLDYHRQLGSQATIAVREYEFQVPYGVVRVDNQRIVAIDEKPRQHFFVNAGIYVLEPAVVASIPSDTFIDMPDVFRELLEQGLPTAAFPLHEYWLDIGRMDDFNQANVDVIQQFGE